MNLLALVASLTLDDSEYKKGLDDAENKASSFGSKLKKGLATAAKVSASALGTAAAGVAALTKQAVANYAEYEQLVGGVETLFGDSASTVMEYANNAFKSAGFSANEYMETVTSFSASLLQSLGGDTEAAAKYADLAITDMADNANKMGSDIATIQNAYQGFAKQNYTMLDNLKLGYGGTKEEMERLLADAEAIAGVEFDISSYADVVQAIHVIQEEMGIAGATAAEASSTISGSFAALKSAWENLVTGLASGEDLGGLINNLVESATTAVGNVMPVATQAIMGVGALVEGLAPIIAEQLPNMITSALPALISAGSTLLFAVVNGILGAAPALLSTAFEAVMTLAQGLINALPELLPAAVQMISDLALMLTEPGTLTTLLNAAVTLMMALADGLITAIPQLAIASVQSISGLVKFLLEPSNIAMLLNAALQLVIALGAGILAAIPEFLASGSELIGNLVNQFEETDWGELGRQLVEGILNGIMGAWDSLKGWVTNAWDRFVSIFSFPENYNFNLPSTPEGATPTGSAPVASDNMSGGSSSSSSSSSSYILPTSTASSARFNASNQAIEGLTGAILANSTPSGPYEIIVRLSDETELARALFDPLKAEAEQRGEVFA